MVSKKKKRFPEDGFDLDLSYITPRIIAMGFPSSGVEGIYRNPLPEVQRFFTKRHASHYKVYTVFVLYNYTKNPLNKHIRYTTFAVNVLII